jgi:starch synthase
MSIPNTLGAYNVNSSATVQKTSFRKHSGTRRPKILIVTPEVSQSEFLAKNGKHSPCVKAGGLADVNALLIDSLSDAGADVHVALPHFRTLFQPGPRGHSRRLHLCQDREFFHRRSVYDGSQDSNLRAALAFQRDVIHYVMPRIRPDLIHCHDWMTGLVPAAARTMGIPSLFTVHNLHDVGATLHQIEDRGIDPGGFWSHLYFRNFPGNYDSNRDHNPISLLASGILAADHMNTVSSSFLDELSQGCHHTPWEVADAVRGKLAASRAHGIVNSLPRSVSPALDGHLPVNYDDSSHVHGKRENKLALQAQLGLEPDPDAPLIFWPSRLDPVQKGCQLFADILYQLVSDYWGLGLQVVFIADGPYHSHFEHITNFHGLQSRIAVHGFSERLSRQAYAASDFTIMPSSFEPCGLSQMVGLRYGSLPIVHATGGLRDTVTPLNPEQNSGNGFAFEFHDTSGLRWAIDQAMRFHIGSAVCREANVSRIMAEAAETFLPATMIDRYVAIYRDLLHLD